jgi:aminopeptidase N
MMRLLILLFIPFSLFAQNNYRSESNKIYWKNKKPFDGYWQQDVYYQIKANIDETTDIITGEEKLTYFNNSPDTLHFVYFHLYQNAFQPGSYLDKLQQANDLHVHYGKYERAKQGTLIDTILSEGQPLKTFLDNTILKVYLSKPLLPNESVAVDIKFRTFYDAGSTRRRMKQFKSYGYKHFNGCQWYPKLCVYDRKSGWNTDQHMNREFYGDFGSWDVELTFASNYVVEATGVLQNENEVLPDTLKQKLQISNFKNKKWGEKPSVIIPYKKGETKTWRYHADNVHDFAFTANPTYRIQDTYWNGVRCVAIVQEPHASKWQNASEYCAKIIECFSRDFGMYEYPKMVVADALDGMEYPMLTLDGGADPGYRGLLVHEVGHNWFYGMLGNNETYRAMLDEGFTQFITAWGLERIDGKTIVSDTIKNKYIARFSQPTNVREARVYYSYLSDATQYQDEQINTHSDMFNGALGQGGGYRHVYAKTATMLYNLQYVLGDSLFLAAMQHYVAQWKICHPYPEDFRNSIIQFTKTDLNWFFDQWMETTKNIDYKIQSVKKQKGNDQYKITLKRKGRMQMPIDLQVISKKDSVYNFYIPNTWFEKQTNAVKLGKWYGWDKLQPKYTATVTIPKGIKNVIIDPTNRLADINNFNNRQKDHTEFHFDSHIPLPPNTKKYRLFMRPDLWYNAYDGFKVGFALRGNYMNVKHNFELNMWLNTHLVQGGNYNYTDAEKQKAGWFSYRFRYQTSLNKWMKNTDFHFYSQWLDGVEIYKTGLRKRFTDKLSVDGYIKMITMPRNNWTNYLVHQNEWSTFFRNNQQLNSSVNIVVRYAFSKRIVNGELNAHLRSATLFNASNYHYIEASYKQETKLWRFDLRTRFFGRIGTGNNLPSESALFFAGANPEQMLDNKYLRAAGFFPETWSGFGTNINHLHFGGGMNLRGYSGYLMSETDKNGNTVFVYKGNSGWAVNAELDFNRIVQFKKNKLRDWFDLNTYVFADAGSIVYRNSSNDNQFSQVRFDAGAGVALTLKKFWFLQNIKPLTVRFDMPFFVSHAPNVSGKNVEWRWMIGINRAF